jgi:PIN domain nuclease of toxin-antitoxin system
MKPILFDSSAIIAVLANESGADKVRAVLADGAISSVNYAEVVGFLARTSRSREIAVQVFQALQVEIVSFDADLAATTGMLVNETRSAGLSLGDRACLALAQHRDAQVLTADRAWSKLGRTLGLDIVVIR